MTTSADDKAAPRRLFLVDGSGYIFRAFHALPPMTKSDGTPINAVYGFCNMLIRLLDDMEADAIAVIFDASARSFRNDIYADYKANRPEPPDELKPQFPLIREAVRAFNVPCIEVEGYEADDIIATYARQAAARGESVTIVSSDKDLMQLVGDGICMYDPMRLKTIGPDEVRERFGVGPEKVVDVQALAGDSTDNVPGVPGIGVKTAAQLIEEYGDLDTLLARAGEIKQNKRRENLLKFAEQARISRELVKLDDQVPLEESIDDFDIREPDPETLLGFLRAQEFRTITARVEAKLAQAGSVTKTEPEISAPEMARYELVTDAETLAAWIARATEVGIVAIDTETTSLDPLRCDLVGVSLAVEPGRACYIPIGHSVNGSGQGDLSLDGAQTASMRQMAKDTAVAMLKPLLEDPSVLKVGHNIKYDMLVLEPCGIRMAPIDDTMVLSYVLDGARHGHGMDELAGLFLKHQTIRYEDVAGKGKAQVTFDRVPIERALDYAAEDAEVSLRLHRLFKRRLIEERMVALYETMERPLVGILARMEHFGIKVDREQLRGLSRDFTQRLAGLEDEIYKLAGRTFNIGSPKQLGEILFKEMGLDGGRKVKTGAFATGADILEDLAAQGHELPARVLEWRQLSKLKSTYADALVEEIHPTTGRVHTCFAQTVAGTGRLSSSDPNLQNIPIRTEEGRKIRRAFVADEGTVLLSADYSQIELRLLAHVAEIEALREAFHAGHDIHAMTASQVFGIPIEGMDPQTRRKAKAINFGIIYGISPFGLARQLSIPQAEARAYIDAYFERYPGIRDYMDRAKGFARQHGCVTTIFGRKCFTPYIHDKNPARRSFAERAAINAPLQGSAADIIKRAMTRLPRALEKRGLQAKMLLQVHDELLFEVPVEEKDETAETVRSVMEAAAELSVPLIVETGFGENWADAH